MIHVRMRIHPIACFLFFVVQVGASPALQMSDWIPLFKGIDHASGTNFPNSTYPHLMVAHALRIDLKAPDVRFLTTPPFSNYVANLRESAGYTVGDFLRLNGLQVAINANHFGPIDYYLPGGTPMYIYGL